MNSSPRVLLVTAIVAIVAAGAWLALRQRPQPEANTPPATITSFETCVAAGHPVVLNTSCKDGSKTFVRATTPIGTTEYDLQEVDAAHTLLTDRRDGFSLVFPSAYSQSPDTAVPGKVMLQAGGSASVVVWATAAANSEPPVTWGDYPATGDIVLDGVSGKRFEYKRCDGPGCSSDIVAYVVVRQGKKYALEFYGNLVIDTTEQAVIDSFKFLST